MSDELSAQDWATKFDAMLGADAQEPRAAPAGVPPTGEPGESDQASNPVQEWANRFDAMLPEPLGEQTSTLGVLGRSAAHSALPSAGGLATFGAGAEAGAALGSVAGPFGAAAGGIIGGFGASFLGAAAVEHMQQYAIERLPDSWQDALGVSERQRRLDIKERPVTSFLGGMIPFVFVQKPAAIKQGVLPENPTAVQRIMANPVTARLFGGAVNGGVEIGQEAISKEELDWRKIAISTAFGLVWNAPTKLGEAITELGARPVRAVFGRASSSAASARPPTVADAADLKVAGPGITEEVFRGTERQDPAAAMVAQEAVRAERSALGLDTETQADMHELARKLEPEVFERYDALEAQRASLEGEPSPHLDAIKRKIDEISPEVSAAYRRAAEHAGETPVEPITPEPVDEAQRAYIASDIKRQLLEAGQDDELAQANAELKTAYYLTRAARFKGAIGTAKELYDREAAIIRGQKPAARTEPLPEHPAARDAEALRRSADADPVPDEVVAKDIDELAAAKGEKPGAPAAEPPSVESKPAFAVELAPADAEQQLAAAKQEPPSRPEPEPAPNLYADKWFASKEKAEAFITKKKIGATHEAVQNGRRFEIKLKSEKASALPGKRKWAEIGKNAEGHPVFEDQRGVRSIVDHGIRHTEPVGISPDGAISTDRAENSEYEIVAPAEHPPQPEPAGLVERIPGTEGDGLEVLIVQNTDGEHLNVVLRDKDAQETVGVHIVNDIERARREARRLLGLDAAEPAAPAPTEPPVPVDTTPQEARSEVAPAAPAEPPRDRNEEPARGPEPATGEQPATGGVVEQPGEGLRGGASELPAEQPSESAQKPKRIRGTRKLSPFDRGERGGDAREHDGQDARRDEGSSLPREGGQVTKPPDVGAGDREARSDSPAGTGRVSAREKIEERSRSNYRITDADKIGVGTPKEKITANIDAIRTLKAIEEEGRNATPQEKSVLVKYTGWGAFAQDMFSPYKKTFLAERDALRSLVTNEEYEAARASTLNAHYTSPDVIRGMWGALLHLGYDGGLALEPSAGIGHFIGLTPDSVAPRTGWTAVELDPLTGRIAKALYGGAEVNVQGFETLKRPSNYYDLVISNVPFGNYNLKEKPYGSYPIHDFFFVKSLDKVRPGGVVAFVTSRYTMDRLDAGTRRALSKSADLVGAIRLPGGDKGAFAGNAGTAVTTDILFLRKKAPGESPFPGANWMDVKEIETPDGPAKINEYFADNPKMMLGEMRLTGTMYTDKEPVLIGDAEGLHEKILDAAAQLPEDVFTARQAPLPERISADAIGGNVKEGGFFVEGGKLYRKTSGEGVEQAVSAQEHDRLSRLVDLRDTVNDLLSTQLSAGEGAGERASHLREKLRGAYDAFVEKHGPINKETRTVTSRIGKDGEPITITRRPNLAEFEKDPDGFKVAAIENYDPESGIATRAAIQTKDVISPPVQRQINGPTDAVAAVLDQKGRIDLQSIGEMLHAETEDEVVARLGDLIFHNPNGREWETADKYLSGDVVTKLEEAREIAKEDASYLRNVTALEKVQPTPLEPVDITAQFGAPWIPPEVYMDFLQEIGASRVEIGRVPVTNEWKVKASGWSRDAISKYGTDRVKVDDIADAALNNRRVTVYDVDSNGTRSVNSEATEQARVKTEALREAFTGDQEAGIDGWVWNDPDRSEKLAAIYNRSFNNLAQRKFDGAHLTLPGMSADLRLRPHQKDAVWRVVQNGNTLLAHVVGAGKTYTMIAAGMEQRRLGLINKPMYVVPNHMLEQFSREFLQAYPNAKILVAQKDEMTVAARKAFVAKMAANDWDGVIITHDAFGRINMAKTFRENYVRDQLGELERLTVAEAAESGDGAPTVKALEKIKKNLESRLSDLLNEERKDEGTTFEETGVDHIFVDEAHKFKNLSFTTRLQRVKGLSQGNSQRAEDLFLKMRYLEQKRPGRSAVFATGTPVSNTMAEIWTMMRYLEFDKLKEVGLDNFDAWASTFGKVVNNMELSADGRTFKEVASFSKFVNVPELISLYSEIADTKTADMLNLPRPQVKTRSGAPGVEIVQAKPSPAEEAYIEDLVKLAESLKGKPPQKGAPNMLSVVTSGRKVATDGRLVDPEKFEFNTNGKIAKAVDNIVRIYKEGKGPAMAQMVFLDMGVPTSKTRGKAKASIVDDGIEIDPAQSDVSRVNLYDDLKTRLVAEGIPAKEIAFIHDASDDAKKAALFAKVRSGEVRVIVGSSEKMGVGTNVQTRLTAMHHIDAPWKPAEVEQRDGRIIRQGNLNPEVQIYRYVTERSFDAFMWQKLDTKAKFISQVLSGSKGSRHAEDIDNPLPEAAEMKAAASGDPRVMEHAELTRQVRQLMSQKRAFDATVSRATWEIKAARSRVEQYEGALGSAKADAGRAVDLAGDKFKVTLVNKAYDSRKEAGQAIIDKIVSIPTSDLYRPRDIKLGEMSGFDMRLELQAKWGADSSYVAATASLVGDGKYSSPQAFVINAQTDAVGLMRKFENLLAQIARQPASLEAGLAGERKNIGKLEATLSAKWPREKEYSDARQKLADLTAALKQKEEIPGEEGAPEILKPEEEAKEFQQSARGKVKFKEGKRHVITLMKDANASTFIHESGHEFLENLAKDSAHPEAPEDLKTDMQTVLKWLGVEDFSKVKTKQHEKFARGFERYMREGVSPSPGLAGVFAKFRNWLLSIYQTVKGLGTPINDDIRRVFDRLLATEPQRTIVAPELEPARTQAALHEEDAALTEPHDAHAGFDRIEAEKRAQIEDFPPEIRDELESEAIRIEQERAARAEPGGEGGQSEGGPRPLVEGGGEPEPVSGGGGGGEGSRALVEGASRSGGEGAGLRGAGELTARPEPDAGRGIGEEAEHPTLATRPADIFGPRESPFLDKAGNIRIENLTSREDVAQAIHDAADANDGFIGDRRGVITDGQVHDLADALGMDFHKLNARKIGQAFNAEQVVAARKLLVQSATQVAAAIKKAASGADEDVMAYAVAKDRHRLIQAQVAGITAEAGRALRAFRSIAGMGEAMNVDQFVRGATGKTLYQLKQEIQLGMALETPQQVSKFIDDAYHRSFGRMIVEYWTNALISNPASQATYSIGTTISSLIKMAPDTAAAAAVGKVARALGREGPTVRFGEIPAQFAAVPKAIAPALKATADTVRTGIGVRLPGQDTREVAFYPGSEGAPSAAFDEGARYSDAAAAAFGIARGVRDGMIALGGLVKGQGVDGAPLLGVEYSHLGAIPNVQVKGVTVLPAGDILRSPGRFNSMVDSFFRAMNYSIEKNAIAYRTAANEGLSGTELAARVAEIRANPTPEIMAEAVDVATELSLMKRGGAFVQALSHLVGTDVKLPLLGETPVVRFVDPFIKIASNVLDQALFQRTPIGLAVSGELRADIMGKNGTIAQDKAIGKMLVGTALGVTFGSLAAEGYITGSGPDDQAKSAMWRLAGYQPYSVRIGDMWYSVRKFDPLSTLMGVSADIFDIVKALRSDDEKNIVHAISLFHHSVSRNILDQSFMKGPADLIKAVEDPERYGDAYVRNFFASFVPFSAAMGSITRSTDPYAREARNLTDAMKAKVPWLAQDLFPRRDVWGEPIPNMDSVGDGLTQVYVSKMSEDPVNIAMLHLGISPGKVDRKIRNVELTDEQYDDFARIAGRMTKMRLDALVQSPTFQELDPLTRHDVIKGVIKANREAARGLMMMKYPSIMREATEARRNRKVTPIE